MLKKPARIYRPNEQRKVDKLLAKLVKLKPTSGKAAPLVYGQSALKSA